MAVAQHAVGFSVSAAYAAVKRDSNYLRHLWGWMFSHCRVCPTVHEGCFATAVSARQCMKDV